jgi:uncharacterized RDD family membrane protein YckC
MAWRTLSSRLIDVLCGFAAYVGARLVWGGRDVFENLPWELLTFAVIYLLLQAIVRGRRLAREGRGG